MFKRINLLPELFFCHSVSLSVFHSLAEFNYVHNNCLRSFNFIQKRKKAKRSDEVSERRGQEMFACSATLKSLSFIDFRLTDDYKQKILSL